MHRTSGIRTFLKVILLLVCCSFYTINISAQDYQAYHPFDSTGLLQMKVVVPYFGADGDEVVNLRRSIKSDSVVNATISYLTHLLRTNSSLVLAVHLYDDFHVRSPSSGMSIVHLWGKRIKHRFPLGMIIESFQIIWYDHFLHPKDIGPDYEGLMHNRVEFLLYKIPDL